MFELHTKLFATEVRNDEHYVLVTRTVFSFYDASSKCPKNNSALDII